MLLLLFISLLILLLALIQLLILLFFLSPSPLSPDRPSPLPTLHPAPGSSPNLLFPPSSNIYPQLSSDPPSLLLSPHSLPRLSLYLYSDPSPPPHLCPLHPAPHSAPDPHIYAPLSYPQVSPDSLPCPAPYISISFSSSSYYITLSSASASSSRF